MVQRDLDAVSLRNSNFPCILPPHLRYQGLKVFDWGYTDFDPGASVLRTQTLERKFGFQPSPYKPEMFDYYLNNLAQPDPALRVKHPSPHLTAWIMQACKAGACWPYKGRFGPAIAPQGRLKPAHQTKLSEALMTELESGRTIILASSTCRKNLIKAIMSGRLGESLGPPFNRGIVVNSVFMLENNGSTKKDRLISNLSSFAVAADGTTFTVNSGMVKEDARLSFNTIDQACHKICLLNAKLPQGQHVVLAAHDLAKAFRHMTVDPSYWPLQCTLIPFQGKSVLTCTSRAIFGKRLNPGFLQ